MAKAPPPKGGKSISKSGASLVSPPAPSGRGGTRREKVETKEAAIVDAAYQMFATKGFSKSPISEIAARAGVAEGTVYLYFANKEALAGGVIAKFYNELTDKARDGVSRLATTREKLLFLAHHHMSSVIEDRLILDLLTIVDRDRETRAGGAVYEMNKRYVAIFDAVVREGVWRGEIVGDYTAWVLRDIFYGGLDYAVKTILITDRRAEASKFTEELVRMITAALPEKLEVKSNKADKRTDKKAEAIAERLERVADRLEAAAQSQ
ncbi:MAG: TetR/AcrR family transcriptional regulator [Pseudomonadota bacterium]